MMTDRALIRLAWSLCGLALTLLAAALLLISLGWSTPLPGGWTPWRGQVVFCAAVLGASVLGWFVATRRLGNPYGWLWLALGCAFSLLLFAQVYAAYALVVAPETLPFPRTIGTAGAGIGWTVQIVLLPLVMLLFPTGRAPSPRWRFLVWTVLLFGAMGLIAGPFIPGRSGFAPIENPLGVEGAAGLVASVLTYGGDMVVLTTIPFAALSLVFRFRQAGVIERQQIKWFAYAAGLLVLTFLMSFFYEPPGAWDAVAETLPLLGLYAAIGVAVLRYRLYDIDLLINRTLVYGSLTAMLGLVYFGGVAAAQALFQILTGQQRLPQLAIVASTLVIAALFNPLRRRVQGFVDRRFYRKKYDAGETLAAFSAKLRDEVDLDLLEGELLGVVRGTVQPAHVSLWLREKEPGEE